MKKYKSFIFDDIKINFFNIYIKCCKIIKNNELVI